jgi:hypothetical protein
MRFRHIALAVSFASLAAAPVLGQAVPRRSPTTTPQASQTYSEAEATVISSRLYRALLGREGDPGGLTGTTNDIKSGRLRQRIETMVASPEFATSTNSKEASVILEQFYQGLLGRSVDPGAAAVKLRAIQEKRYTDEVMAIIQSNEFKSQLATAAGASSSTAGVPMSGTASAETVSCQARVVEKVRNDLNGFVEIHFDQATANGSTITGTANDVADGSRRMHYTCNGGSATFSYDDGRGQRSAPAEGQFSSDIVRSCLGEIRTKVMRAHNIDNLVIESAGLMPMSGDTQAVRGLGFEKTAGGGNGANFTYSCDMKGTQILVSSFRNR